MKQAFPFITFLRFFLLKLTPLSFSFFLSFTLAAFLLPGSPVSAQSISGQVFEDRDGDGILDPGEPLLSGIQIDLFGQKDAGGGIDQTIMTNESGYFSFSPGNGCYLLLPHNPEGWRMSLSRSDSFLKTTPGYTLPVGQPRFAMIGQGLDNLRSGTFRHTSMGDSIAWNWNSCLFSDSFWYSKQVRSRIACSAPSAIVTLDEAAVKGEHTDDLLVDDHDDVNNVFRVIEIQPELITLSMIGNDLLGIEPDNDPTQAEINRAVAEVLDARQNLQEALSALTSEIPGADIALNTLYDNLAYDCYASSTNDFHREWLPLVNQILRDLAWGQTRRASINEVAADFAHEDQDGTCYGFDKKICRDFFQTDNIHPNNDGYKIIREKVWEAVGGMNLGPKDAIGRTSISNADFGILRHVRRLLPSQWQLRNGGSASDPEAALNDNDGDLAAAITLGIADEEFRLSGFADWLDEVQIVKVIAGVRYKTAGTVADDFYRIEASVTGIFRPEPGHAYIPTNWNFYTPIVGGGGPNQPPENPDYSGAKLLVLPNVNSFRDVSATLTKNPILPAGSPDYEWPAVTHEDLSTATIRIVSAPVSHTSGNDNYQIEIDAAWLDLYGWEKPRPPEVQNLEVNRLSDGTLEVSFDPLSGTQRYNLYFGRISCVHEGIYDHGASAPAGPLCNALVEDAGGGRLKIVVQPFDEPSEDSYILVTAHVDDVESPSGHSSNNSEIDRSQSICR